METAASLGVSHGNTGVSNGNTGVFSDRTMDLYGYHAYSPYSNETDFTLAYNVSNATDPNEILEIPHVSFYFTFFKAVVMFLIIITAIFGNSLVIASVLRFKNLHIISNSFIVSLAFADLLVAILVMPFSASQEIAGRWLFGQTACDIFNANDVLFSTASLLHLCCISMDRYIAITDPFHYERRMTKKKVALMLSLAWGASAMISHIPVHTGLYTTEQDRYIAYPYGRESNIGVCLFVVNDVYAIISSTTSFWIPTVIMVFTYAMVFKEARRQEKAIMKLSTLGSRSDAGFQALNRDNGRESISNGSMLNGNGYPEPRRLSKERNKIKREHKAAKTLGIIMSAFLLCWLPFFLWYVITTLCGDKCHTPDIVVSTLFWVGYFNSALNPIIYAFYNKEFSKAFKQLLQCQKIHHLCTKYCCRYCVRRGWIRGARDAETNYLAGLPPRSSRPSLAPSSNFTRQNSLTPSVGVGFKRNNSYYNGSGFSRTNYDTVPEKEAV